MLLVEQNYMSPTSLTPKANRKDNIRSSKQLYRCRNPIEC